MDCTEDDEVFGLLLLHTQAKPAGASSYVIEYLDVIMSDHMGEEGHNRLASVHDRLVAAGNCVDVERLSFDRPHPELDGSSSFKIIRYARRI
jgi:hypothetical protein